MDKEKRKLNYWKLKEAGFTGQEANKLKDRSDEKIQEAIALALSVQLMKNKLFRGLRWQPEQNEEENDTKE